jgi:hypothetical protein
MRALPCLLASLVLSAAPGPQQVKPPALPKPAETKPTAPPLSFFSQRFRYAWDQLIPLKAEVDGIKLNSIFFNRREVRSGLFKGAAFGTRAQIEVTNTALTSRAIGFAVAVFDADDRLVGVACGGTRFFSLKPGETISYDMPFEYVLERLPLGASFVLSMELAE